MRDVKEFCCQNENCADYGKRGGRVDVPQQRCRFSPREEFRVEAPRRKAW
jgi:hypothetical protein